MSTLAVRSHSNTFIAKSITKRMIALQFRSCQQKIKYFCRRALPALPQNRRTEKGEWEEWLFKKKKLPVFFTEARYFPGKRANHPGIQWLKKCL
jgi:hypothetical protein